MGCAIYTIRDVSHQVWSGYPDTPDLSSDYPYQSIVDYNDTIYLCVCTNPFAIYEYTSSIFTLKATAEGATGKRYKLSGGTWEYVDGSLGAVSAGSISFIVSCISETNHDIYYGETLEKTHTIDFPTGAKNIMRIKSTKRLNTSFVRNKCTHWENGVALGRVNI